MSLLEASLLTLPVLSFRLSAFGLVSKPALHHAGLIFSLRVRYEGFSHKDIHDVMDLDIRITLTTIPYEGAERYPSQVPFEVKLCV